MCVCSVAQSSLTLLQPHGPPGSSVHGVSQARILERVAISYFMGSFQPRGQTHVSCISCIGRRILYRRAHLGRDESHSNQPRREEEQTDQETTGHMERMTSLAQQPSCLIELLQ